MARAKRTITGGIAAGIRTFTEYLARWLERSGKIHQKMRAKGTAIQMDSLTLMEELRMENICNKEYAQFMEETLEHMVHLPVSGICVLLKLEDGTVCSNYFGSKMMDKMIYAGVIQQDVTWDILKANNAAGKTPDKSND